MVLNWLNSLSQDVPCHRVMKATKGKEKISFKKGPRRPSPNRPRHFLSSRWWRQCWATKANIPEKDILIQAFLFYRKSNSTTVLAARFKWPKKKKSNCLIILVMFTVWIPSRSWKSESWPTGKQPVRRVDSSDCPWASLARGCSQTF